MSKFDLQYNSQKDELVIPEYGRNVQNLIDHAKKIEDDEMREAFVHEIVKLVNITNPYNRNIEDYEEKLWNHVFKIGKYELNVPVPEGITIYDTPKSFGDSDLTYPQTEFKFRHYGSYVQNMIKKALAMDDPEMQSAYSEIIASYMKLAYRTFNREHYVNDDIIKQDLLEMSKGKLTFSDGFSIENLVSMKEVITSNTLKINNKKTNRNNNNNNNNTNNNNTNSNNRNKKRRNK